MRARHLLILATLCVLGGGCIPFGDVWIHFGGHVADTAGAPVAGASVQIFVDGEPRNDEGPILTNEAGDYAIREFSCPCDFRFELRVTKDGYEPYSLVLRGNAANALRRQDVVLRLAGSTARR